jgi:hypothetical protein
VDCARSGTGYPTAPSRRFVGSGNIILRMLRTPDSSLSFTAHLCRNAQTCSEHYSRRLKDREYQTLDRSEFTRNYYRICAYAGMTPNHRKKRLEELEVQEAAGMYFVSQPLLHYPYTTFVDGFEQWGSVRWELKDNYENARRKLRFGQLF